jgi:cyclic pyranopterin phosphate synthase
MSAAPPSLSTSPRADLDPVRDRLGRPLQDLRLSLTDRCNFRCTYCMPRHAFGKDHRFLPRSELLAFGEIERLVRLLVPLGLRKLRLTGGEPLLRPELETLIAALAAVPGIEDISLTTNGSVLSAARARQLAAAGLKRLTVSLDALDPAVFRQITDADYPVTAVLDAIAHAQAAGLKPVKINVVVKRGVNEDQVLPLAAHFRGSGCVLRFIEYMDVGSSNRWRPDEVVPAAELVARVHARWPLQPLPARHPGETARRWRYADGGGEIGVIASVTQPFCGGCTRARLSADGRLFTCLFASQGHDLRALLRGGHDDATLRERLRSIWQQREDRYSEQRSAARELPLHKVEMSYIGG